MTDTNPEAISLLLISLDDLELMVDSVDATDPEGQCWLTNDEASRLISAVIALHLDNVKLNNRVTMLQENVRRLAALVPAVQLDNLQKENGDD